MKDISFEIIFIVWTALVVILYAYSFNKLNDRVKLLEEEMYLLIEINKNEE